MLNTVPGLAIVSRVPQATVRLVPRFAGLDVSAGVTAYQVAASIHDTVSAVTQGQAAARRASRMVSRAVQQAARQAGDLGAQGTGLAVGATSGAFHAALESGMALDRAARQSASAVLEGLARSNVKAVDALWGAGYGSVRTAMDLGQDRGSRDRGRGGAGGRVWRFRASSPSEKHGWRVLGGMMGPVQ